MPESREEMLARLGALSDSDLAALSDLAPPPPAAEEIREPSRTDGSPSPPLILDPDGPRIAGRKVIYPRNLADYAPIYGLDPHSGARTIKRWVAIGKKTKPPDLPPLDSPGTMAAWWRRHMKQRPPQNLLDFERETSAPEASANPPADASTSAPPPPAGVQPLENENRIAAINLPDMQLADEEEVQQARQLVAANFQRVSTASKNEDSDGYRRWFPIWISSVEQLRTLEKAAIERRKATGKWIAREPVLAEISQLIESLRMMHAAMPEKILAALQENSGGRIRRVLLLLKPQITDAIQKVRSREANMLMNIGALEPPAAAAPREATLTLESEAA